MKKLLMLAVVLVMTCTIALAATQSPYAKAKEYGKQIITLTLSENQTAIDRLGTSVQNYIINNIESEEQLLKFFDGLEAGIREGCKELGLSDEDTDEVIDMVCTAIIEDAIESLE
ncbi:MAG: hypothetical protein II288_00100 [Alistipes sp.]|nr:hypothetical protein [Alistipes sp.]